jgi:O-antigen/teichoic acid export membrane protein
MTNPGSEPEYEGTSDNGQFGRASRRITVSVLSGYGNTILISGLGALATRLITIHVGPTNYGLFVTALTFVSSVMLLTDLGITAIMGRDIAKNPNGASEILGQNLGFRLTLSVLVIPLVIFIGLILYKAPSLRWTLVLFAISVPFNAIQAISLGYYVASIRNYVASGFAFLQQVIFVAGVAIAIPNGFGIIGCATSYLVATAVSGVAAYFYVRKELRFKPLFDLRSWREVFARSASLGAIQVINLLYLRADTLLLSKMAKPRAVGLYGVAYSFINFVVVAPSLILTSVMPLMATSSGEKFGRLLRRTEHSMAVLGAAAVMITVLFAPQSIAILSGHRFLGASTALRLLGLSCYFSFLNTALGFAAVSCNRHHRLVVVSAVGLVLNVALNIVLIPRYGINGSALATLISEFISLVGVRYIFAKDVGSSVSLTRMSLRPVLVGAGVTFFSRYVLLHSWHASILTVLWAPAVLVLYFGVLALVGGLPEEITLVRERVKSHLQGRRKGFSPS